MSESPLCRRGGSLQVVMRHSDMSSPAVRALWVEVASGMDTLVRTGKIGSEAEQVLMASVVRTVEI